MSDVTYRGTGGLDEALANGRSLLGKDPAGAAAQAREIIRINPNIADAHRLLAAALRNLGRSADAEKAELAAIDAAAFEPALVEAAIALADGRLEAAERVLRPHLRAKPSDAAALRMLAQVAAGAGHDGDAEMLLRQALRIAPGFMAASTDLEAVLARRDAALAAAPPDGVAEFEAALRKNEELLALTPDNPNIWLSYGHVLRIAGRRDEAISAYRRALALMPAMGEAWWSLADLKTVKLDQADVAAMETALATPDLTDAARVHIHFALGKALEDIHAYEPAFRNYSEANRLKRLSLTYNAADVTAHVRGCEGTFTREFFAQRNGQGSESDAPIFILGMPRSGSTLVEQILSCHSKVEATEELFAISKFANLLSSGKATRSASQPFDRAVAALGPPRLKILADTYLSLTGRQRKSKRPHYIDKMPDNWLHIGLIQLILPNARIIDVRRHPLDCCLSNFKQNFAEGREYSYDLADVGGFYRDYVRLMAHVGTELPGRVHRIIYEELIDAPEREVRRLLDELGLPFESECLRFHDSGRAVKTSSSEQVRRPINREGIGQWKPYAPWLGPLEDALGPVLDLWPGLPPFRNG